MPARPPLRHFLFPPFDSARHASCLNALLCTCFYMPARPPLSLVIANSISPVLIPFPARLFIASFAPFSFLHNAFPPFQIVSTQRSSQRCPCSEDSLAGFRGLCPSVPDLHTYSAPPLQEEFRDICEETRVVDACDDEFLLQQYMDNSSVRRRIMTVGRKSIIGAKIDELESLKQTLQMVKEQNHDSTLKLKALKDGIEASDSIAQTDIIMAKLKELNAKLGSTVANKKKLEFA